MTLFSHVHFSCSLKIELSEKFNLDYATEKCVTIYRCDYTQLGFYNLDSWSGGDRTAWNPNPHSTSSYHVIWSNT